MISAVDNAAMSFWNLIDTIYLALSQAMPDRVPAAHHAQQGMYTFYGRDAVTGFRYSTPHSAGGARNPTGWLLAAHGDTRDIPIEVEETFYSAADGALRVAGGSAGTGEFRGGLGLTKVYRTLQDCHFVTAFERTKCPRWRN